jgi:hypothetical protein
MKSRAKQMMTPGKLYKLIGNRTVKIFKEDFSDDDILSFISYVRENEVIVYLSEGPVSGTFKRHKILDQNGNIGWCHIHYWMWESV